MATVYAKIYAFIYGKIYAFVYGKILCLHLWQKFMPSFMARLFMGGQRLEVRCRHRLLSAMHSEFKCIECQCTTSLFHGTLKTIKTIYSDFTQLILCIEKHFKSYMNYVITQVISISFEKK